MTVYTLNPTAADYAGGGYAELGTWTPTGGTMPGVLSDSSPAIGGTGGTYLKKTVDNASAYFAVDVDTVTIPADEEIVQCRACIHYRGANYGRSIVLGQATTPGAFAQPPSWSSFVTSDSTTRKAEGAWQAAPLNGEPKWTQALIDKLLVVFRDMGPAAQAAEFSKAWVEVQTTKIPTVSALTVDGGSPVTTTTRPSFTWAYNDDDGYPQTLTEAHIYSAAQYTAPGFAAGTTAATAYVGTTANPAGSTGQASINLQNGGTYRIYLRVAKTVNGAYLWSDWDYDEFTITVTQPSAPYLRAEWDTALQRATLEAAAATNLLTANQSSLETDTTGWVTAGENCTASRSTTKAFSGAASLRLSSTASGTMWTSTLTGTDGVPVDAGDFYTAAALVANNSGSTSTPAFIGLRFYDAVGTLIGETRYGRVIQSLNTEWRFLHVTAQAPTGAAFAAVIVGEADTPASGRVIWFDGITIAPTPAATITQHNLLANGEAVTDTDGWTPTDTTLSRSTAYAATGVSSFSMVGTAVTAGRIEKTTNRPPVIPGLAYTFALLMRRPAGAATHVARLRWYDGSGTPIGTWISGAQFGGMNGLIWAGLAVTATAPENAASVALRIDQWQGIGDTSYVDALGVFEGAFTPSSVEDYLANYYTPGAVSRAVRVQRVPNPSHEVGTTGWTSTNLSSSRTTAWAAVGEYSRLMTRTGAASSGDTYCTARAEPGYAVTACAVVLGVTRSRNLRLALAAYNAAGTLISTGTGTTTATDPANPVLLTFAWSPPIATATVRVRIESVNADLETGDGFYVDAVALLDGKHSPGSVAEYLGCYYTDGSRTDSLWAGTAHGSQSIGSLAVLTGGATTPAIEIEVSSDGGGTWEPVRAGAETFTTAEQYLLETDTESPRDRELLYRARTTVEYTPGLTTAGEWSPSFPIDAVSDDRWWIVDPLDPDRYLGNVRITEKPSEERFEATETMRPLGARYPVVLSGPLGGLDGAYDFEATDEWGDLLDLLDHQGILLIRSAFNDQKYVRIQKRSWSLLGATGYPRRSGQIQYVEVARP
ncbi:MAG: hypothetical protein WC054_02425 [Candidatus Nanopelagicales bacterium]